MPASLVQTLRNRYLESITSVQPASGWKLLVLDQETQSRINGFLKMYDILEQGVQRMFPVPYQPNPIHTVSMIGVWLMPLVSNRGGAHFEPAQRVPASRGCLHSNTYF